MKLLRITEPQASFLEIEIVGRFIDDEDADRAASAAIIGDHLQRSRGTSCAVPDATVLSGMLLEVLNDIDDAIVARDIRRIGGVDTVQEARGLHTCGQNLLTRLRRL